MVFPKDILDILTTNFTFTDKPFFINLGGRAKTYLLYTTQGVLFCKFHHNTNILDTAKDKEYLFFTRYELLFQRNLIPQVLFYNQYIEVSYYYPNTPNISFPLDIFIDKILQLHHIVDKRLPIMNPFIQITKYLKEAKKNIHNMEQIKQLEDDKSILLEEYIQNNYPLELNLCHGDITKENLLVGQGYFFLIDYEYSFLSDIYIDLVDIKDLLSSEEFEYFISQYQQKKNHFVFEEEKLILYKKIKGLLNRSWVLWQEGR